MHHRIITLCSLSSFYPFSCLMNYEQNNPKISGTSLSEYHRVASSLLFHFIQHLWGHNKMRHVYDSQSCHKKWDKWCWLPLDHIKNGYFLLNIFLFVKSRMDGLYIKNQSIPTLTQRINLMWAQHTTGNKISTN